MFQVCVRDNTQDGKLYRQYKETSKSDVTYHF